MSVYAGPEISNSGLILALDANNSKSYPGSGTTWSDLSGNGNHASMFSTVPTSTDGGFCFDFSTITGATSASASIGFTFASNMIPTTGSFTLSTWIKNPPSSSGQVGLFSNAGGADGYRFGVGTNGVYTLISGASSVGYSEPTTSFLSTLSSTLWYNVVAVFDRAGTNSGGTPQWQIYLNGVYQNATNMVATQPAFTAATPGLVRSACCGLYTGKLATFAAYSRALSSQEIKQNFNALRGRFGI